MARLGIKSEKVERALEFTGIAVGLTLAQMIALYLLFAVELAGRFNVFLIYRRLFEKYIFPLDWLYFLFVGMMYRLFGGSYLHVPGFNNVFKLTFFTILIINTAFVVAMRKGREDEAG
ncbi:MAG: hypothetical protein ACE5G7_02975 [Candidatus Hydrothermarchaeaceae archaeon]